MTMNDMTKVMMLLSEIESKITEIKVIVSWPKCPKCDTQKVWRVKDGYGEWVCMCCGHIRKTVFGGGAEQNVYDSKIRNEGRLNE